MKNVGTGGAIQSPSWEGFAETVSGGKGETLFDPGVMSRQEAERGKYYKEPEEKPFQKFHGKNKRHMKGNGFLGG